ncbi:MAG: Uma2 family endonuclease [Candidatus Riflebacteria bacterium]|nr:Uma2 family endonuclease [Candidatus Riflebacteria bacterium]
MNTGSAEKTLKEYYTYKDLLNFPENERWEVIDGQIFDMSPAPSRRHQEILWNLSKLVAAFLEGKQCKAYFAPFDVRLPRRNEPDEEIETVVQPDLVVVCDETKLDEKGCRGAPDWVVEIISPSTSEKDLIHKKNLYELHKVPEYWVVFPGDRVVQVFDLNNLEKYVQKRIYIGNAKAPVQVLPGLIIDLQKVFQE